MKKEPLKHFPAGKEYYSVFKKKSFFSAKSIIYLYIVKNNENQTHTQKILKSATAKREHYLEVKKKKSNITIACLSEHIQVGINDITF